MRLYDVVFKDSIPKQREFLAPTMQFLVANPLLDPFFDSFGQFILGCLNTFAFNGHFIFKLCNSFRHQRGFCNSGLD